MMSADCCFTEQRLWVKNERVVMSPALVPLLLGDHHQLAYTGVSMTARYTSMFFDLVPKMEQIVKTCIQGAKTARYTQKNKLIMGHDNRPNKPFTHPANWFRRSTKVRGIYKNLLVCIDRFNRWVEGFPCRRATVDAVAMALYTHIFQAGDFLSRLTATRGHTRDPLTSDPNSIATQTWPTFLKVLVVCMFPNTCA